jgi:hypothetical protein
MLTFNPRLKVKLDEWIRVDPEEFIEWLENQPEGNVVGKIRNPYECPLANWLKDKFCAIYTFVSTKEAHIQKSNGEVVFIHLDDWMKYFMSKVDNYDHLILKEDALEILGNYFKSFRML